MDNLLFFELSILMYAIQSSSRVGNKQTTFEEYTRVFNIFVLNTTAEKITANMKYRNHLGRCKSA